MPHRDLDTELSAPKYAHCEMERRWLVDSATRPTLDAAASILIEDRYLTNTRMRLRRMSDDNGWQSCKLTKKYVCSDASARPIVTAYLDDAEYAVLCRLPGHTIRKQRYAFSIDEQEWSLDKFENSFAGLEILEAEADDVDTLARLTPPSWAAREITHAPQWQGGSLAAAQTLPENA